MYVVKLSTQPQRRIFKFRIFNHLSIKKILKNVFFFQNNSYWLANGRGTVVELLPHLPKVKGSSPAPAA
jgi:hypothetical protein